MKLNFHISIIFLALVLIFQNCSKVSFYSSEGVLTAKMDQDEVSTIDDPPENEIPPIIGEQPPGLSGKPEFVCILSGPGKSVRLGVTSEFLIENGHTPATVCMSEYACRNIVSQKFSVKSVESRGYCPDKNPHVVPLSDEAIQAKIDSL